MVVNKFAKLFFKKKNHHKCHPQPNEELSEPSLHAFHSHVSKHINQLAVELKPGSENISLSWFLRCFGLLPIIHKAFAKLVMDIDYPMSQWNVDSIEGYLNYTKNLLELLNSMSSSLSHLGHAKLSLAYGLALLEKEKSLSLARKHLKPIQLAGCFSTNFGKSFHTRDHEAKTISSKELIVHEGVKEMKSIGFWVCGVLLSCLYGDFKPYLDLRQIVGGFDGSLIATLDSKISEKSVKNKPNFSEMEEINNFVAHLVAGDDDATKELQRKLCEFEKLFGDISKEVDHLFNNVMSQRSKLMDGFRLKK
ncbi:hypothetical protein QL285_011660 [Trifolium repens]|nr:hypothetical protein QL285_011660 [Trifolium repens]